MMAFTSTIDTRRHVIGDLVFVTGTFTNPGSETGGDILLVDQLSKIFAAGANGNAAGATDTEIDATVGTTLTLVTAAGLDGTWWAIGQR